MGKQRAARIVEVRRNAIARTAESGAATRPHPGPGHSRDDPAAGRAEAPSTMSCRGRGTLTVRRSDNPFFQTTTGDIGQDFTKEVEYAAPTVERAPPRRTLVDNYDFGFLYEKMSDDIGAGQHHAPSNLSRAMGAQDTPAQLTRLKTMGAPASAATIAAAESRPSAADRVERILEIYKHAPKKEHEMYMTTSNVIGALKPNVATFTAERRARNQGFSNSFQGVKYRNQGLTTAVTKSNVHDMIDMM